MASRYELAKAIFYSFTTSRTASQFEMQVRGIRSFVCNSDDFDCDDWDYVIGLKDALIKLFDKQDKKGAQE